MSVHSFVAPGVPAEVMSDWHSAAQLMEHTLLVPEATRADVSALCSQALQFGFRSVVVNSAYVAFAAVQLHATAVKVGTVVGFPLGANLSSAKLAEAEAALHNGAHELDMVMNIGALKSGDRVLVRTEIQAIAQLAHSVDAVLKVILENGLLTQGEKILACALSMEAGADFVKTSTGFGPSGATAADVAIMRGVVGHKLGVKAAGGIRTAAQFIEMIEAGANRIGCSRSVDIVREMGAPSRP
jgi:deoxyribose-phosphate aldolase